ncbi:hypothetical protein, partial [Treponema sp. R80B11-R83G3]
EKITKDTATLNFNTAISAMMIYSTELAKLAEIPRALWEPLVIVAGVLILLKMFNVSISFMDVLIFVIAIIWAVYIIVEIVSWITGGFKDFWHLLQMLAVHLMVLANLLIASNKG